MIGCEDDKCFIDACRAGNTEAYGVLVRRYQDRLYPTVLRLTGCAEDALDLLQDSFFRAFEKLDRFQGESSFYTWVYRIAVNLALSGHRRKRAAVRWRSHARRKEAGGGPREGDPSEPLERAERNRLIQEALDALAPDHRAVVVMKEFDGLRYDEIGAILGVPVGTVRSRLHRARCELRERLRGLADDDLPAHSDARGVRSR